MMFFNLLYGNDDETLITIIIIANERKHFTGADIEITLQIHNEKHMMEAVKQMLTFFSKNSTLIYIYL